jgi:hypothetical protein
MLSIIKNSLVAIALVGCMSSAHADFIQSDYLQSGDNRVALDKETGIEWLSLLVTDGSSFSQTTTRLEEGGDLYGWRLPSYIEYASMITGFFGKELTDAHVNFGISTVKRIEWFNLFGQTYGDRSAGYMTKANGALSISGVFTNNTIIGAAYNTYSSTTAYAHYGTYLVSDGGVSIGSIGNPLINANNQNAPEISSVPVPASLGLLGFCLLGIISRRKIKKS